MALILFGVVLALQIWQWHRLSGLVARARMSRLKALLVHLAWSMVPLLLAVSALLGAIGLESAFGLDVISEAVARTTPFLFGLLLLLGLLGSAAFGIASLASALRERRAKGGA
jgi:protein-S-isoprenylcysteine O-methyltransferase Ste14